MGHAAIFCLSACKAFFLFDLGVICGVNIDDCVPNPCANRGECEDLLNKYQCNCQSGYTGEIEPGTQVR